MSATTCPKCNRPSDDPAVCSVCGLDFNQYAAQKHERLGEVSRLLTEGKFAEAKEIAVHLPQDFPDNRNDFLLLLSNINRDISIVDKCELAKQCCDDGDYVQASFLLRNIKAFDKKLDETVISLRRRIERLEEGGETFDQAAAAFDRGDFQAATQLFARIDDPQFREKAAAYLEQIKEIRKELLSDAVLDLKEGQLNAAENKFKRLREVFPELDRIISGYLTVVAKRQDIQDSIVDAAIQAHDEKRYIEAKILYLFLGIRFPDVRHYARHHISEIGDKAIVTFADMDDFGGVDLAELGLDTASDGTLEFSAVPEENGAGSVLGLVPDSLEGVAAEANREGAPDSMSTPANLNGLEVADFIF